MTFFENYCQICITHIAIFALFTLPCCHQESNYLLGPDGSSVDSMTNAEFQKLFIKKPTILENPNTKKIILSSSTLPANLQKPITLSMTENTPLKDIFFQMARQAEVDIVIDFDVTGSAALHTFNRPFINVVRELCAMNHLRYHLENGILRIEPDLPYLHNYNIQFLSLTRQNKSSISIATDIFTSHHQSGNVTDNGSNTLLTGDTKSDFWGELEAHLSTLLRHSRVKISDEKDPYYAIHKQAGIISIFGTQAQHQQVEKFLKILRLSVSSQVLIEAKIVEVNLKDEFKTGINWNILQGDFIGQSPMGDLVTPGSFNKQSPATPNRNVFTIGASGKHLTGLLSLINMFGTVRTLSSPRLTVMNNQAAMMKVATNHVYFRINYNRDVGYDSFREHENVSSDIQTVPIGLVMVVHPSINIEDGSITMTLRPTVSRIVDQKADPAVSILSKESQQSFIPEVQVREFDSLLRMKSGEIIVVGGLFEEKSKNDHSGLPYLDQIPWLDFFTGSKSNDHSVSELVIFLKATIIEDSADSADLLETTVTAADHHLYTNFTTDPRPILMKESQLSVNINSE